MAEPDPFGRGKDEDPLAAMGWSDAGAAPAEVETRAESASIVRGETAATALAGSTRDAAATRSAGDAFGEPVLAKPERRRAASRPHRPSRLFSWLPKLLFLGAVLVIVAAVVVPLAGSVEDAFDSVEETVEDTRDPRLPDREDGRLPNLVAPRGLGRGSMLLRGNLAPALKELRSKLGGQLNYVRIEAERVDLQTRGRGTLTAAQARWDGEPRTFSPVRTTAAGNGFPWSKVDPSAPRRFVRTATKRVGKPASAFNYAVLLDAAGLKWQVFLRDGTHFTASPDGRRVKKVG
ncbi:MAG: hypothetical protein AVDCRST_MAG85-3730 [uncultured Solirubrobacteraceae bacterium]|uniref:Uncharacterized protein n=1 Tax=uncultured Solirubrobacteraceae bacterium TaxID=1162706 RepID=A0A6J4TT32_9ACTN|nr:MAG: hypothetical protein AVDCRST_MAG85-3730 [uncultured Solirubrobacteraceae bacterium]